MVSKSRPTETIGRSHTTGTTLPPTRMTSVGIAFSETYPFTSCLGCSAHPCLKEVQHDASSCIEILPIFATAMVNFTLVGRGLQPSAYGPNHRTTKSAFLAASFPVKSHYQPFSSKAPFAALPAKACA